MDANKRNTENKEKMRGPEEEGEGEGEKRGEIFIPMLQELRCAPSSSNELPLIWSSLTINLLIE